MSLRSLVFVAALALGAAPAMMVAYQLCDLPGANAFGWGGTVAALISAAGPAVVADAALLGLATPAVAAGALAFLAPPSTERLGFTLALAACAVGWGVHLWLELTLADSAARSAATTLLNDREPVAATRLKLTHLDGFAAAARILYLALGAALVGAKLRPSASVAAAAVLALVLVAPAQAGSIKVKSEAKDFEVSVAVRPAADADPQKLALTDGAFSYAFDADAFTEGAYAERFVIVEWTPKVADVPAPNVQVFSVELPVLLRKWRAGDAYRIEARPFVGIGQKALKLYERMTDPASRWTRFVASLQQSAHYAGQVSPELGETKRALNSAVDAFVKASVAASVAWMAPPAELRDRLAQSFSASDPDKLASLNAALDNVDSLIWKDLPKIDASLSGESCEVAGKTFAYLAERRDRNSRAYELQLNRTPELLETKRAAVMAACRRPASEDPGPKESGVERPVSRSAPSRDG